MPNLIGISNNRDYVAEFTTAWRVRERGQSGLCLERLDGTMLARLGTGSAPTISLWDTKRRLPIEINLHVLTKLCTR